MILNKNNDIWTANVLISFITNYCNFEQGLAPELDYDG